MANRKQRRRRERTFRHYMPIVDYDEEGNEIEISAKELRARQGKAEKQERAARAATGQKRQSRQTREPPPPSWGRSIRRGGLWGGVMLLVVVFLVRGTSLAGRLAMGLFYALAFIPLTYWVDRFTYRSYLRRAGKTPR
jgi:hypothetical protein